MNSHLFLVVIRVRELEILRGRVQLCSQVLQILNQTRTKVTERKIIYYKILSEVIT